MKRVISLIVSVLVMLTCSVPVFAANDHISADDTVTYVNRYNELLSYGLTAAEANQLLQVETIIAKLERSNLKVEEINGKYQVVSAVTNQIVTENAERMSGVTTNEFVYLTDLLQQQKETESVSYEAMLSDIAEMAKEQPGRSMYRVSYDNGTWIQVDIEAERVSEIEDNEVKSYFDNPTFPNEEEIRSDTEIVTEDGDYNYSCEISMFAGVYYAQCYISQNATYSNDVTHVEINSIQSGQAAAGLITIANAGKNINVASTDLNVKPKIWCEVENAVVYTVSGSVGVSIDLVGPVGLSLSVNGGNSWTQYAIIRSSVVAMHSYGAYYTVVT